MRKVALLLFFSLTVSAAASSIASAEITWQQDLRTAHASAAAEQKLLLLHFYSSNCVWCDRLEEGSFKSPVVAQTIDQNFIGVKVLADKNAELVEMFKVTKFPTDVIVTTDGKTLSHSVSPQTPDRYVAMLQSVVPTNGMSPQQNVAGTMVAQQQAPTQTTKTGTANSSTMPSMQTAAGTTQTNMPMMGMTSGTPVGPANQLAGARTSSFVMQPPPPTEIATANQPLVAEQAKPQQPELAMEGFCAVTVIKEDRWVEGNPEFGVLHLGKLYLFTNAEAMQTFLGDPVTYTPVLNEIDVVRFFEERRIVAGKREWGLKDPTHHRMFFFADEAAMNHFWNEYERYTDAAIAVMDKAVKDANPEL